MNSTSRSNRFGGSAGGGGYDYQAEAYALIASKILAQESVNWVETGCDRVPVSIQMETGTGGDDLRITLRSGVTIDLQAKRGLQRSDDLWCALIALAHTVQHDDQAYGVLLTNTEASRTVRIELRSGVEKIGQGVMGDLPEIVEDFLGRLKVIGITDFSLCARIRIVIRDLDPGSFGEEETFAALRKVLAQPDQVGAARSILVADGHDLIKRRGRRDNDALIKVIKQAGLPLSPSSENQHIIRQAFIDWSIKTNEAISIPTLRVKLPIARAWIELRAMTPRESADEPKSLAEQVRDYHEWHRLADTSRSSETVDVEFAARKNCLQVVVGGPGSGKSTLLRRLASSWSVEGKVVLRVSLRAVALRMRKGETFNEALFAVVSDGFLNPTEALHSLVSDAVYLLADGLDETDPDRADIAEHVRSWALANENRHIVLTTRPVGHNPAWFEDWKHFELLPLKESDVKDFVETLFGLVHSNKPEEAERSSKRFLQELEHSSTATIAARNPQLLGFLIALFVGGHDISGNRFRLFENIVERIREQTVPDRVFRQAMDAPVARRTIECLAWLMIHFPGLSEAELVERLGQQMANELSIQPLQGQQVASQAILFWTERGLVERLSTGGETVITFVHTAFQEFFAAKYLVQLADAELLEWIDSKHSIPEFRGALLFTGGTDRLVAVIDALTAVDSLDDPVSIAAFLAADVLAEAEEDPPTHLREKVFQHLAPRLKSDVPMVAYEAGEKLRPLATLCPTMIGPMALELAQSDQHWTKEIACALGLLAGDNYVDMDALLAVYPAASDTGAKPGRDGGLVLTPHQPLIQELIIKGAEYLLCDNAPESYVELVKDKFISGDFSLFANTTLYLKLAMYLSPEELLAIRPEAYEFTSPEAHASWLQRVREADRAFLEAVLMAGEDSDSQDASLVIASEMNSLARLSKLLRIGESPAHEVYALRKRPLEKAFIEVIRGAILVSSISSAQLLADAQRALAELANSDELGLYGLLKDVNVTDSDIDPDWSLARSRLQPELLLRAMEHPSWFVCRFAALLLLNCIELDVVRGGLKDVLVKGGRYALHIIAQVAADVWEEEAASVLLNRLEKDVTENCAPLVRALGDVCDTDSRQSVQNALQRILQSRNARLVEAATYAVDKLDLTDILIGTLNDSYQWWLHEGPQDPEGTGTIPENAAASLLSLLVTNNKTAFEEIRDAGKAKRGDVRRVAITELCRKLAEEEDLIEPVFSDVIAGKLPASVVDELSRKYPDVCSRHYASFARLLDSDNAEAQIAGIRALADGWAAHVEVEKLRSLLKDTDMNVRDEAVSALRHLAAQRLYLITENKATLLTSR
jgi:energy-coupling factor transporter ATP-binding protein EcfA2